MTAGATTIAREAPARTGAYALAALLALAGLSWSVTHVSQRGWDESTAAPVTLGEQHYRVGPDELLWLESFSSLHFSAGEAAAREVVAAEVAAQLDRIFGHAEERLPEFVDWYYSLRGEYSRAAMAALSAVDLAEPGYVANRAASMLLPEDVWAEDLAGLERRAAARLDAHHERVRAGWLAEVTRRLAAHRVPAPLSDRGAAGEAPVRLDGLVGRIAASEDAALRTRLSLSTAVAGGVAAGPALWRAASARRAATAGRAAARAAARGATRAGTAAAGGAAVCSVAGPAAFGCALLAGAGAWIATDWALLRIDEALNREELTHALEQGLADLRGQVELELLATYDELIAGHYAVVREDIRDTFVPARAGAGAGPKSSSVSR